MNRQTTAASAGGLRLKHARSPIIPLPGEQSLYVLGGRVYGTDENGLTRQVSGSLAVTDEAGGSAAARSLLVPGVRDGGGAVAEVDALPRYDARMWRRVQASGAALDTDGANLTVTGTLTEANDAETTYVSMATVTDHFSIFPTVNGFADITAGVNGGISMSFRGRFGNNELGNMAFIGIAVPSAQTTTLYASQFNGTIGVEVRYNGVVYGHLRASLGSIYAQTGQIGNLGPNPNDVPLTIRFDYRQATKSCTFRVNDFAPLTLTLGTDLVYHSIHGMMLVGRNYWDYSAYRILRLHSWYVEWG